MTRPPPLRSDCFALPGGARLTPVDAALGRLREVLGPVTGTESVALFDAAGRTVARDVAALRDNPPAANSAVDGYAVRAADTEAAGVLPLAEGRAAAGAPHGARVPAGHALRILTGAVMPAGTDAVIMDEEVVLEGARIRFEGRVRAGANVRPAAEDMAAGQVILPAGTVIGPQHLAVLAAAGHGQVEVRKRLRVAVLSTGDEVVAPGSPLRPGQIHDANRPMLLALAARWGHEVLDLGHVPDDPERIRARLDDAAARADVILSSGGASAGDADHVSALMRKDGEVAFWRIAMKPGRPLALGFWRDRLFLGLPGNPVAAFVTALVFARPALARLAGGHWPEPLAVEVPAAFHKEKRPGRREFLRGRLRPDGRVEAFRSEGSGLVSGLGWANGLIELGDDAAAIEPGTPVRFLPYAGFGL